MLPCVLLPRVSVRDTVSAKKAGEDVIFFNEYGSQRCLSAAVACHGGAPGRADWDGHSRRRSPPRSHHLSRAVVGLSQRALLEPGRSAPGHGRGSLASCRAAPRRPTAPAQRPFWCVADALAVLEVPAPRSRRRPTSALRRLAPHRRPPLLNGLALVMGAP